MKYRVNITDFAIKEAEEYADYIRCRSNDDDASDLWWNGLLDAIFSLETFPGRNPGLRQPSRSRQTRHQLIYHSHRILYEITDGVVTVVRVYHGARRARNPRPPTKDVSPDV